MTIYHDGSNINFGEPPFYDDDGGGTRLPVEIKGEDGSVTIKYIDRDSIKVDPAMRPNYDERFTRHYEQALLGEIPTYFAEVPTKLLVPFDVDFRPDKHPMGIKTMEAMAKRWQKGDFSAIYAYQRGFWFVVSDDYNAMFTAILNNYGTVVCLVMGELNHPMVTKFQRIPPDEVSQAFGFT